MPNTLFNGFIPKEAVFMVLGRSCHLDPSSIEIAFGIERGWYPPLLEPASPACKLLSGLLLGSEQGDFVSHLNHCVEVDDGVIAAEEGRWRKRGRKPGRESNLDHDIVTDTLNRENVDFRGRPLGHNASLSPRVRSVPIPITRERLRQAGTARSPVMRVVSPRRFRFS
jgi:hypothetical protein